MSTSFQGSRSFFAAECVVNGVCRLFYHRIPPEVWAFVWEGPLFRGKLTFYSRDGVGGLVSRRFRVPLLFSILQVSALNPSKAAGGAILNSLPPNLPFRDDHNIRHEADRRVCQAYKGLWEVRESGSGTEGRVGRECRVGVGELGTELCL